MVDESAWERVQAIFNHVRAIPADQREAALTLACDGDSAIRAEIESLLEHDARAGHSFLLTSENWLRANLRAWTEWAEQLVGTRIGQYTLRRFIASGGMGCVFEAHQEHPSRAVAIKILRPGCSAPSAWARFRVEPEILARLRHPNIAQVFEAGVYEDGTQALPYFAMELVPKAQSLSDYVNVRRLQANDRLRLFARICDAIQHGHQKGIVHRDLKPGNILVGSDGEPKIIDFGVARATDADLLLATQCTGLGDLVGTVHYMSPEQCDGGATGIDTRSDIYSLGVVLYELLAGIAPYDTSGLAVLAAIRVIKETTPRRPSEANRSLRGDLDAILLKALEKDPAQRYGTAAAFAQDLRRHLAGEPVEARPPTRFVRLLRAMGQHPVWATAAACVAIIGLSIFGGGAAFIWLCLEPYSARVIPYDSDSDDRSGSVIELKSRFGLTLRQWKSSDEDKRGMCFADVLERPAALGGGRIILIGGMLDPLHDWRKTLAVYPAKWGLASPDPLWTRGVEPHEIPREFLTTDDAPHRDFTLNSIAVYDIFPGSECPDSEIVAIFGNHFSQRCVRIYRLDGELLYEFWHDGGLNAVRWLPERRLLVFSGDHQAVFWNAGSPTSAHRSKAAVVFAIQPELHRRCSTLPLEKTGDPNNDVFVPRWYLTPAPLLPDRWDWEATVSRSLSTADRENTMQVTTLVHQIDATNASHALPSVCWTIDADGKMIPGSKFATDAYKSQQLEFEEKGQRSLPDWRDISLEPFSRVYSISQAVPASNPNGAP